MALILEIQDNGEGFDPELVPADRYGLVSIRERAQLFGGGATIESNASTAGTRITVKLATEFPPAVRNEAHRVPATGPRARTGRGPRKVSASELEHGPMRADELGRVDAVSRLLRQDASADQCDQLGLGTSAARQRTARPIPWWRTSSCAAGLPP